MHDLLPDPIRSPAVARALAPRVHSASLPLDREAALVRRDILDALHAAGGGHYGGSLSAVDLLLTLYRRQLRVCPEAPRDPRRDRLVLSKGHAAIALYAVLRRLRFFDDPLWTYASLGSALEGHPDMTATPGVDFSTGSLGQGASVGVGMAIALREAAAPAAPRVWVILGDGECQEGQVWEAAMLAAQLQLDRIHAVVDHNRRQEWGWGAAPGGRCAPPVDRMAEKWAAFGWHVAEIDGHDTAALERTFERVAALRGRPSVVIAHTTKGKGVPQVEADPVRFHCARVTEAEHRAFLEALR